LYCNSKRRKLGSGGIRKHRKSKEKDKKVEKRGRKKV